MRDGLVVGGKGRNIGAVVDCTFHAPAGPKSRSSQEYVSASPFASVAAPVRTKGVLIGIEQL